MKKPWHLIPSYYFTLYTAYVRYNLRPTWFPYVQKRVGTKDQNGHQQWLINQTMNSNTRKGERERFIWKNMTSPQPTELNYTKLETLYPYYLPTTNYQTIPKMTIVAMNEHGRGPGIFFYCCHTCLLSIVFEINQIQRIE